MYSYVTLVSSNNYLIGALALNESLKRVKSIYKLTVLLSLDIETYAEFILQRFSIDYLRLKEKIFMSNITFSNEFSHWVNTFDKLYIFELIQFEKLVFLDCDMLVVKNIDHLFEREHMTAVVSDQINDMSCKELNSGLIVIKPEFGVLSRMIDLIEVVSAKLNNIGDQDIIRFFYSNWQNENDLKLDLGYNIYFADIELFLKRESPLLNKIIYVVHFVGIKKPWMYSIKKVIKTLVFSRRRYFFDYICILYSIRIKLFLLSYKSIFLRSKNICKSLQ